MACFHPRKSLIIYIAGDRGVKASLTFNYSVLFRFNLVEQGVVDITELIVFDTNHGDVAVEFRCTSDKNTDFSDADGYILVADDDTSNENIDRWCSKFDKTKSLIFCRSSKEAYSQSDTKEETKERFMKEAEEITQKYVINIPQSVSQFRRTNVTVQPASVEHTDIKESFTKMIGELTGKDDLCFV